MSNTGHKGITRVDNDTRKIYGYLVRVGWRKQKMQKFISDGAMPTPDQDLDEAIRLRNEMENILQKPRTERHVRSSGVFVQRVGSSKKTRALSWRRKR